MSGPYKIIRGDDTTTFEDRSDFENTVEFLESEGEDFETQTPESTDGGTTPEVVEDPDNAHDAIDVSPEEYEEQLPNDPSIQDDPVDWLPGHFIDQIQGVPTVNRKGYAVIASKYNVSVTAEPVTLASETGFEYAEFQAVATTESGEEYSGFGSAHVDRMDGDDQYLLNELAETRALKRATAWATGVGLTAVEEIQGEP